MFTLELSHEQQAIRNVSEALALDVLRPHAERAEREPGIPAPVVDAVKATGLVAPVSEEYGGQGRLDALTAVLVAEALAYGDPGIALGLLAPGMVTTFLELCGDDDQRMRWLPAFALDGVGMGRVMLYEGFGRGLAELRTTARLTGSGWVLDGRKDAVANSADAVLSVIVAREQDTGELGAFVVDGAPSGLTIERDDAATGSLGLSAARTAAVAIRGLAVDQDARLAGAETSAVREAVNRYRLTLAAIAVGTAGACFDYASGYANQRTAFGRPISSFQSIGFLLVDMRMAIDAARFAVWEAACAADQLADAETLTDRAVSAALTMATRSARDAVQVLGGHGFLEDHPVERWYRAAAALSCMDFDLTKVGA